MPKRQKRFGRPNKITHATTSPNYARWSHTRHRCHNPDAEEYKYYGARGIHMISEWRYDFFAYEKYIMSLPNALKEGYTLDRINNDGNYEKGNLRWANHTEQVHNRRLSANNKSGVKGVSWCKQQKQWRATITVARKSISLGRFNNIEDAITARKKAEIKYKFNNSKG